MAITLLVVMPIDQISGLTDCLGMAMAVAGFAFHKAASIDHEPKNELLSIT